jgi:hypothetical protein
LIPSYVGDYVQLECLLLVLVARIYDVWWNVWSSVNIFRNIWTSQ